MVAITASQINSETDANIDTTILEYLIDNAINYVNFHAGTSISNMSGTAGSKTVTVSSDQSAVLKPLIYMMVRARQDKGPNISGSPITITALITDPEYSLYKPMIDEGINRLRGRSFERT